MTSTIFRIFLYYPRVSSPTEVDKAEIAIPVLVVEQEVQISVVFLACFIRCTIVRLS